MIVNILNRFITRKLLCFFNIHFKKDLVYNERHKIWHCPYCGVVK